MPLRGALAALSAFRNLTVCFRGNVNAGAGRITDVLFVNDGSGGNARTIDLSRSSRS